MSCQCGSQKQPNAPNTINPVNIGVLCFLFGLEGVLCTLVDLVPDAIKAVIKVNPTKGNADQVFGDLLKKAAKRGLNIIIDEVTGNINMQSFCSSPPPPLPEQINYSDIYIFIAELVPILSQFFSVNELLTGDSTKLLDKIVGYWLYQKWFENCECKKCDHNPENDYPLPEPIPHFSSGCPNTPISDINQFIDDLNESNAASVASYNAIMEQVRQQPSYFFPAFDSYYTSIFLSQGYTNIVFERGGDVFLGGGTAYESTGVGCASIKKQIDYPTYTRRYVKVSADYNGAPYTIHEADMVTTFFNGPVLRSIASISDWDCCPPIPPVGKPPKNFCDLYPYHPDCIDDNNKPDTCEDEYAECGEFMGCDALLRRPVRKALIKNGVVKEVTVIDLLDCGVLGERTVEYFECPPEDVYGCTDPAATNYNPQATIDDGSCIYQPCSALDNQIYELVTTNSDTKRIFCQNSSNFAQDPETNPLLADNPQCADYIINKLYDLANIICISGCTDAIATNFNPDAVFDDGSCTYE